MSDVDKRTEWKTRFEAWQASGISAAEWYREQDIKVHQMYYWMRKFKRESLSDPTSGTRWLTVNMQDLPTDSTDQAAVLIHVGTMSLEVRPGTNMELFSKVMRIVQNQ